MEKVKLDEIRDAAVRIATRLALGEHHLGGPQRNIMEVESWVAWSTVCQELYKEGYLMVHPDGYGARYALSPDEMTALVEQEGTLFCLQYRRAGETISAVPEPNRQEHERLGPVPR